MRLSSLAKPCRGEKKVGLGDRNAARAKSTLENCKSKREGIGALECETEEAGICNLGARARSERDKGL